MTKYPEIDDWVSKHHYPTLEQARLVFIANGKYNKGVKAALEEFYALPEVKTAKELPAAKKITFKSGSSVGLDKLGRAYVRSIDGKFKSQRGYARYINELRVASEASPVVKRSGKGNKKK